MFHGNIKTKSGFQSSVNIAYDLHDETKIKDFIPTNTVLPLIEELILSTSKDSTTRARVLIGAYGRGKSHLILTILALLSKKDETLFTALFQKLEKENKNLHLYLKKYVKGKEKLLPVVVQGSSASLTQSLLYALQQSLKREQLENLMPDSHFKAVIETINQWKLEYPKTYKSFSKLISTDISTFLAELEEFNTTRYEEFITIFPTLTSGSDFNPYAHSNVVELYEEVSKKLKKYGYNGIFVVYDEFSKYLESNIAQTGSDDVKMLQDFAEKCDRSGSNQLHLLLISHKTLTNYIEQNLPKNKIDGWMGVSGRFAHHYLLGDFKQMYEMTSAVILHKEPFWSKFLDKNKKSFTELHCLCKPFDFYSEELEQYRELCYPLHPVTLFLLPPLAEKVAQNERTLFTFLSSNHKNTLQTFLREKDSDFPLMTPDFLYDYFEPLFKKEAYTTQIHQIYTTTNKILHNLTSTCYEAKIIKTIAIIYIVEQFELLSPTKDVVIAVFAQTALEKSGTETLLNKMLVDGKHLYCKQSDGLLKLKQPNSVDIVNEIAQMVGKSYSTIQTIDILNQFLLEDYLYPTAYNEDMEIIRYFQFEFIVSHSLDVTNFQKETENNSVGTIYAIVPNSQEELEHLPAKISEISQSLSRTLFIFPKKYKEIREQIVSVAVIEELKKKFWDDVDSLDELEMRQEDLNSILSRYVDLYKNPELGGSVYFHQGKSVLFKRKSHISSLLSEICYEIFEHTPIINNEVLVKDVITTTARNSRNKVVNGLLEKELKPNLGLVGTGQDVFFMRSALSYTGIFLDDEYNPTLNLNPRDSKLTALLTEIDCFFSSKEAKQGVSMEKLYDILTLPQYGYGIKKGLIPIFLAVVLHSKQKYLVLTTNDREIPFTADSLNNVNEAPYHFKVTLDHYDYEKEIYLSKLKEVFQDYIPKNEHYTNIFQEITAGLNKWYIQLPQYTKSVQTIYKVQKVSSVPVQKEELEFLRFLKKTEKNGRDFVLNTLPKIFSEDENHEALLKKITNSKKTIEKLKSALIKHLILDVKFILSPKYKKEESLTSIIHDFLDELNPNAKNYLFPQGEERILQIFSLASHNDEEIIEKLAKECCQLRTDDWNSDNILLFLQQLNRNIQIILDFNQAEQVIQGEILVAQGYQLSIISENGQLDTKTFEKVENSKRGQLLFTEIETALEEMGDSISIGEKRQILMSHLERLC